MRQRPAKPFKKWNFFGETMGVVPAESIGGCKRGRGNIPWLTRRVSLFR